jgi:hypothetical protein
MASRKEFSAEFLIKVFKFVMTRYEQGFVTKLEDLYLGLFDRKHELDLAMIFLNNKKMVRLEKNNNQIVIEPYSRGKAYWELKVYETYPAFFAVKEY